jgi:UDP-N-acetylmuramoyl-tripeptide--D-alanyl-D-alanine ligase
VVETGRAPPLAGAEAPADVVEVGDTLAAWGDLARAHIRAWRRSSDRTGVVAITGSAGKTTTKELCAGLLEGAGACHATSGNLNNRVGVPAVAFGIEPRHRFAVFEVGMSVPGEIAALGRVLTPDVAVIVNVGVAHAAGVGGTRAGVAEEKGARLASLDEGGTAVVCADDPAAMGQLARTRARAARTFGRAEGADYRLVERVPRGLDVADVRIRRHDGTEVCALLPIPGEAAALDLAAALAAAEAVAGRLDEAAIGLGLQRIRRSGIDGRMQVRRLADGTVVLDDSYNANPESVLAALRTLAEIATARRAVVVLGEMRELGPEGPRQHAAVGQAIARAGVRLAVSCGGLADTAIAEAERAGVAVERPGTPEGAAGVAVARVLAGDVVLVKGSRSVGVERVVAALARARGGEV